MKILPYTDALQPEWDELVRRSRNGTFLFERGYMDYHRDRYPDCSLLLLDDHGRGLAAFPATRPEGEPAVCSHAGLTYGGLLVLPDCTAALTGEIIGEIAGFYRSQGCRTLRVKPVPHIYHRQPAEEELYWLWRNRARLSRRTLSSSIDLQAPLPFSELRRRKVRRARKMSLSVSDSPELLPQFWQVLGDVLQSRHHTLPVHTLAEISGLQRKFPGHIRLFTALSAETSEVLAGTLAYISDTVVHLQYIAASKTGRDVGALDFLVSEMLAMPWSQRYFDFGISTESGGRVLNEGLTFQKEGFGARAVCYDTYELTL